MCCFVLCKMFQSTNLTKIYIVQCATSLSVVSRTQIYMYVCHCLSPGHLYQSICIQVGDAESLPQGEWDHYHKFPRQLHLSSHYPTHLPMSHRYQSLPKKHFSLGSHLVKEVVQKFALTAGRKSGWNTVANKLVATSGYWWLPGSGTELSVWTEYWAAQLQLHRASWDQCRSRLVPYFPIRNQFWAVQAWK